MPQGLGHPQASLPNDLQHQDHQKHFPKQRQRRCLLGGLDFEQQLGRQEFWQVDCPADEHARQENAQVERDIFQHPQKGCKIGRSCIVIQAFKVFAEQGGQDQR